VTEIECAVAVTTPVVVVVSAAVDVGVFGAGDGRSSLCSWYCFR